MKIARRMENIRESETLKIGQQIKQLQHQGKSVINFAVGELDFETPTEIKDAVKTALDQNKTRYAETSGIPELKTKICAKLQRDNNIPCAEDNILVSNGSKQVLYSIFQILCNPGDEVIIPTPFWVSFSEQAKLAGAKPVFVPTKNHQLDVDSLKKAITNKTTVMVINTPNNPTGAVYNKESLKAAAELAVQKNITIISDEAYELLTYETPHTSIASLSEDIRKQTVTVQSFSKIFSMTGFRLGYLCASPEVVQAVNKLQSHLTSNPCTFAQYGAIAAYMLDRKFIRERVATLKKRRDLAYRETTKLFDCIKPEGAFYLLPNISKASKKLAKGTVFSGHLLDKAGVAVVPGDAFGAPDHIRISYALSEDKIKVGFERIGKAIK
ncbi:pyridoxal phosphate-dependent aminotransferase [Candidatus Woesearchaeota archaeon]|nr:pyridoxal phosphate-dependent aminotransferase [Candidatus Woesearchaeota archaeon]